jgi:alpha-amylase
MRTRRTGGGVSPGRLAAVVAVCGSVRTAPGGAQDNPVILQWWEVPWADMEYRMPDFFVAGYGAVWTPPVSKAGSAGSVGYDVLDRFDLGRPGAPTAYGTESNFKALVQEFHAANGLVYVDGVLNHNMGRQTSAAFQVQGGYPGFWMAPANPPVNKQPTDNWGDFHAGVAGGYLQSENPGGARYDLYRGDLVALIDIAQETNHSFIRHPVEPGDPRNIPGGTVYNRPDPNNRRFYPDRNLTPRTFTNPGTARNPGAQQFTVYPYNTTDPLQGDPVTDNGTGLLMRWSQWMLDEFRIDGYRLDAIKHTPSWFWDTYFDTAVYQRRRSPSGAMVTPFSFGECVESQSFTYQNFIRKDAFGNRDCLDVNGSGELRNLLNAAGLGNWQTVLAAHLDNADNGLNDGSIGVNHVFSHDNGSTGDGSSAPPYPTVRQQGWPEHAYVLMRTGPAVVYHNARGIARPGGFWPRQGVPVALGVDPATNATDPTIARLVQLHNWYGRGEFNVLNGTDPVNPSLADVIVFERRTNLGGGAYSANVLVGVSDSYSSGVQFRSVLTSFPAGTRLVEMTGNHADPVVDPPPGSQIPQVLTVDANRRVLLPIPNNQNASGVQHHKGFVVYGPPLPEGTLTLTNVGGTIPADPAPQPSWKRRIEAVPVISTGNFSIQLTTSAGDPGGLDTNTDDNALFRIDQGFVDWNGNGVVDVGTESAATPGYEGFVTIREPLFGSAGSQGQYVQAIDATRLAEGYHYLSVAAFRHRGPGDAPLFREFRKAFYIDQVGPAVRWLDEGSAVATNSFEFRIGALDRTATRVHLLWDVATGVDPVPLCDSSNQAVRFDRFEWRRILDGMAYGAHTLTIVAFEVTGRSSVTRVGVDVTYCRADVNGDGSVNVSDFLAFLGRYAVGDARADFTDDGQVNVQDFLAFLGAYAAGC